MIEDEHDGGTAVLVSAERRYAEAWLTSGLDECGRMLLVALGDYVAVPLGDHHAR